MSTMPGSIQHPYPYRSSISQSYSGSGAGPGTSDQRDEEERRLMLPCRFYVSGYCHRGNRCRFYHPGPVALKTAYRVPPLPSCFVSGQTFSGIGIGDMSASFYKMGQPSGGSSGSSSQSRIDTSMDGRSLDTPAKSAGRSNGLLHAVMEQSKSDSEVVADGIVSKRCVNGLVTYEYDTPNSSSQEDLSGTTLFDHIDWENFLAPGQKPPPIYTIPEVGNLGNQEAGAGQESTFHAELDGSKKLSPKEELQMKVKFLLSAQQPESESKDRPSPLHTLFKQLEHLEIVSESIDTEAEDSKDAKDGDGAENASGSHDDDGESEDPIGTTTH